MNVKQSQKLFFCTTLKKSSIIKYLYTYMYDRSTYTRYENQNLKRKSNEERKIDTHIGKKRARYKEKNIGSS
jgi:hypothetical protein